MLKESTVRDMECTIEKSNKKALNEVKKKLEEMIDMKDEHFIISIFEEWKYNEKFLTNIIFKTFQLLDKT